MSRGLLRPAGQGHASVGYAELFFDLVYVFAVTQLSHYVLAHHDLAGVLQATVLLLTVWWAWNFMAWATNWLDPERAAVRLMIFLVMLASLAMSASIPQAFGDRGLVFVIAYLAMQIGRTAYLAWVMRREQPRNSRNLARATIWFVLSAPFWIWGALAPADARLWLWAVAIGLNYLAPMLLFWLPGLGRSDTREFSISGGHMAERCALLIIIALGEGILLTGATFADMAWTGPTIAAFAIAFAGSIAMWWIYFDMGAKRGAEHIEATADTGDVARVAYTYLHIPIVAGIIGTAVGDELVLAHPAGHVDALFVASSVGGAALFVAGCAAFKRASAASGRFPLSHLAGLVLLAIVAGWALAGHAQPLAVGGATVVVLAIVAAWEWRSFHGGWIDRPAPARRAKA